MGLPSCVVKIPSETLAVTTMPVLEPAYQIPSVAEITTSLERIRAYLESAAPLRIAGSVMDTGPDHKFAPLSYPMGVIDSGLLAAAKATGDAHFNDLPVRQFQFYRDHLAQAHATEDSGERGPMRNLVHPTSLDSCGAIGTAMIQARLADVGPDMNEVIQRWAEYVHHQQYRLPDGTLARQRPFDQSLWLDDSYMGPPILAEMGKLTGHAEYSDDAARQMELFYAHLFLPNLGLFTHGMHMSDPENQPRYCWGRANGWYAMGLVTVLDALPENHPERAKLVKILQTVARGWASYQSGSGLWHQLLDQPDSYLETSCSAMFTFAIARGVDRGWLDAKLFAPVAVTGWNALQTRIDDQGHVSGTCIGTTYAADYVYYYRRPMTDDVHGYGPVLLAGSEMIELLRNPHLRIDLRTGAIMANARTAER
jgi:rhamnogalacturonyl hydrolase YesR